LRNFAPNYAPSEATDELENFRTWPSTSSPVTWSCRKRLGCEFEEEYPYDEFTLSLELGNDAMRSPDDIADALRRVAQMIENSQSGGGSIMDNNGNTVGKFETS
jgi:hypothetical protein